MLVLINVIRSTKCEQIFTNAFQNRTIQNQLLSKEIALALNFK